jgi:hypothetical protein
MKTVPDIQSTPREVRWSDVGDFEQLDERVSAVTNIFGSVIGVNDGYLEWCPDGIPPSEQERLAWIWLCNPGLDAEILSRAQGRFRDLVLAYRAGQMLGWWDAGGR